MLADLSDARVASSSGPLYDAYRALLGSVEQALGFDDLDDVSNAYQAYSDCYLAVLAGRTSPDDLAEAGDRLTALLGRLVSRPDVHTSIDAAAADYIDDLADACVEIDGEVPNLEEIVSVATATTLLAWLYGATNPGNLLALFGGTPNHREDRTHIDAVFGDTYTEEEDGAMPEDLDTPRSEHDDEIVWQEFAIGDDGQIVERSQRDEPRTNGRAASVAEHDGAEHSPTRESSSSANTSAGSEPRERPRRTPDRRRSGATTSSSSSSSGDPVDLIDSAARSYFTGLAASGVAINRLPNAGFESPYSLTDLERQSADVTASYLRAAHGMGTLPDLYGSYARLLESVAKLVEHHVAQVQQYERLAAVTPSNPRDRRRSAERLYEQFVSSVRDAWLQIDPATLTPEMLATINRTTAQAVATHDAVMGPRDRGRDP